MINKHNEASNEEYEQIMLALLLNEHAEQQGEELLREFEEACVRGELPEVPAELDRKCRKLIDKKRKRIVRKELLVRSVQTIGRVVTMLFVVLGVCTALVLSVDAMRTPAINLIREQYKQYSSIGGIKDLTNQGEDSIRGVYDSESLKLLLDNVVPEGYECVNKVDMANNTFFIAYLNSTDNLIVLDSFRRESVIKADTENAEIQSMMICGYDGLYLIKDNLRKVIWYMPENEQFYILWADGLEEKAFWALVDSTVAILQVEN